MGGLGGCRTPAILTRGQSVLHYCTIPIHLSTELERQLNIFIIANTENIYDFKQIIYMEDYGGLCYKLVYLLCFIPLRIFSETTNVISWNTYHVSYRSAY